MTRSFGNVIHYTDQADSFDPIDLSKFLTGKGFSDVVIAAQEPTVEDCFMELMEEQ